MKDSLQTKLSTILFKTIYSTPFSLLTEKNHSTTTALLDITDDIFRALDNSKVVLLVLLDYSKAFDCANHMLILAKLKSLGFQSNALEWMNSYLSGRSQQVSGKDGLSEPIKLINGVPQGSILGPLLFTILLLDISSVIKHCKYHLYADDTQIYISGKVSDIFSMIDKVNADLLKISNFSKDNCLRLNTLKSNMIIFGSNMNISKINDLILPPIMLNNEPIERVESVKNLGVFLDETMSWDVHVNYITKKAHGKLYQAYRHKNFYPKTVELPL